MKNYGSPSSGNAANGEMPIGSWQVTNWAKSQQESEVIAEDRGGGVALGGGGFAVAIGEAGREELAVVTEGDRAIVDIGKREGL